MSSNQFIPNINSPEQLAEERDEVLKNDRLVKFLLRLSQWLIVGLFFIVSVFFLSDQRTPVSFDKTFLAFLVSMILFIILSFSALRLSRVNTVMPLSLLIFWLLVGSGTVSTFLNGDYLDSVRGSFLEVQTVGFLAIIGLIMTTTLVLQGSKKMAMGAIVAFGFSATVLLIYNLIRIFAGPETLAFGTFTNNNLSPIGNLNDLAIFSSLIIILGLITLLQLPLRRPFQYGVSLAMVVALLLLSIVNLFYLWSMVGFFALLILVYILSKNTWPEGEENLQNKNNLLPLMASLVVCLVSAGFVFSGDYFGDQVKKLSGIEFTEVLPSNEGTLEIMRSVSDESPLFGNGPNRFVDAWRLHKNQVINETVFWDTKFTSGSSYVLTSGVNLGLVGLILLLLFHLSLVYLGYQMLVRNTNKDAGWYYIGSVSFAGATFVWLMTYFTEPSAGIFIIGALFTGLVFVSLGSLSTKHVRRVSLVMSQKRGFVLMSISILITVTSVGIMLSVNKQYIAERNFNQTFAEKPHVEFLSQSAQTNFALYPDDRFLRQATQALVVDINRLLSLSEPTEIDRENFFSYIKEAEVLAQEALKVDNTNPDNYSTLAGVYRGLAIAGLPGASDKTREVMGKAQALDPINPAYHLIFAELAFQDMEYDLARQEIGKALQLKSNFTEALLLLAQIDIKEENTLSAIATTRAIISLEPRNPSRYFQLGVLLSAEERYQEAIRSLQSAVELDKQFANARYLLALAYIETDQLEEALEELRLVSVSNPDNEELKRLILDVESGVVEDVPETNYEIPPDGQLPNSESGAITSELIEEGFINDGVINVESDTE